MEAPKMNEYWHVKYGEAVKKEYNIIVRINEDKKAFNPKNWRCNDFKCEHKGKELIVNGMFFIDRFTKGHEIKQPKVFGDKKDKSFWADKPIQKGHPDYS
jgi:hypothetical protein